MSCDRRCYEAEEGFQFLGDCKVCDGRVPEVSPSNTAIPVQKKHAATIVGVDLTGEDDTVTLELPKGLLNGIRTGDPVEIRFFVYKV